VISKKYNNKANFYYCKFEDYAQKIGDNIAVSIALNRQAINAFRMNNLEGALEMHQAYSELLFEDQSFVGIYNIGVCLRLLGRFSEALTCFENCKKWSQIWQVY
jgi:tetratricopeptide (TPR) repeat protein